MQRTGKLIAGLGLAVLASCGERTEGIAPPTEPSFNGVPVALLSGPTNAGLSEICTWTATASGGTGPYTFAWDWSLARGDVTGTVGYESEFTGHVAGDYYFIVTVTDANSLVSVDTLQGTTDGGAGC